MGYEIYSDHPQSQQRKHADFDAWSFWAPQNAPWTGVGIPDMARLLQRVCKTLEGSHACVTLDTGGVLDPLEASQVYSLASGAMTEKLCAVFEHAQEHGYGVRVVFSKGMGAVSASQYLAKA
jgi:hypothetical protein